MTEKIKTEKWVIRPAFMKRTMLIGSVIGFVLIGLFLLTAGEPKPEWGKYWRIRPLIIVPLAGAMGGLYFYFMGYLRKEGGWIRFFATMASIIGFIIALWLGSVLGLDGTYWN